MRHTTRLLLAALAFPVAAQAACDIGTLAGSSGTVMLTRDGITSTPLAGSTVCTGDRYATGPQGVAVLAFRDGTRITVGKDSEFGVRQWQERRLLRNVASFDLARGAFRAVTGTLTQRRHRFEVQTVIATIGIRGTDFWGGLNLTPDALDVVMLDGKGIYVKNDTGEVELASPGLGTTVKAGHPPSAPKSWPEEKLGRAVATVTP